MTECTASDVSFLELSVSHVYHFLCDNVHFKSFSVTLHVFLSIYIWLSVVQWVYFSSLSSFLGSANFFLTFISFLVITSPFNLFKINSCPLEFHWVCKALFPTSHFENFPIHRKLKRSGQYVLHLEIHQLLTLWSTCSLSLILSLFLLLFCVAISFESKWCTLWVFTPKYLRMNLDVLSLPNCSGGEVCVYLFTICKLKTAPAHP